VWHCFEVQRHGGYRSPQNCIPELYKLSNSPSIISRYPSSDVPPPTFASFLFGLRSIFSLSTALNPFLVDTQVYHRYVSWSHQENKVDSLCIDIMCTGDYCVFTCGHESYLESGFQPCETMRTTNGTSTKSDLLKNASGQDGPSNKCIVYTASKRAMFPQDKCAACKRA
jgi:hypothetical protein